MMDIDLKPDNIKKLIEPENFSNNITSYIKEFKETNMKDKFKDYKDNSLENILEDNSNSISIFSAAVSLAYDDAKRRFSGIGEVLNDDKKTEFFEKIANEICNIFENPENDFDDWHQTTCNRLNDYLDKLGYDGATYGKAQKIINMTFKYLYCLTTTNKYDNIFQKCHIPLDRFTLEWCRRYLKDKPQALNSDTSWSGMGYDLYITLQNKIREQLAYPLYAEFIIWPEIQKHIAAEEFILSFQSSIEGEKWNKRKLKGKKLSEKFNIIRTMLPEKNL